MANKNTQYTVSVKVIGDDNLRKLQTQMEGLAKKTQVFNSTQTKMSSGMQSVARTSGQLQNQVRNVSFQMQDFVVQVTNGTDASRALGMQLPQLLGSFGALGAAAGVVAAFLPVIVTAFSNGAKSTSELATQTGTLVGEFESFNASVRSNSSNLDELTEKWGKNALAIAENNKQMELFKQADLARKLQEDTETATATIAKFSNLLGPLQGLIRANTEYGQSLETVSTSLGGVVQVADEWILASSPIAESAKSLRSLAESVSDVPKSELPGVLSDIKDKAAELTQLLIDDGQKVPAWLTEVGTSLGNLGNAALMANPNLTATEKVFSKLGETLRGVAEPLNKLGEYIDDQASSLANLKLEWDAQYDVQLRAGLAMEKWNDLLAYGLITQEEYNKKRAELIESYKSKPLAPVIDEEAEAQKRYQESLERSAEALLSSIDPLYAYISQVEKLDELLENGHITMNDYAVAVAKADEVLNNGFGKEAASNLKTMNEVAADFTKGAVSGFVDLFVQGKQSFDEWLLNFARGMTSAIAQMQIFNALKQSSYASFFGFAHGGAVDGTGLPHGVYNTPTQFGYGNQLKTYSLGGMLGESGPEAILPLMRNQAGQLGVSSSPVNVVVNNNSSSEISVNETEAADGTRTIEIMVQQQMRNAFASGSMDKAMRANYGIRRRGE